LTEKLSNTSHTPKISVIVAAYNQERFIGRCLRSLLHQTLAHIEYEIIAVDDGSMDKTSYALELFCDPLESVVKVIKNEKNLGLPASLNRAIRAAEAPFVVRVDSDDFVNANFLNFLLFYLETNPNADAVACDYLLLDDSERVLERGDCMEKPIACGIMFKKSQLLEIGLYDESFLRHEERELRIRFERKYVISRLELPLYRYRRHENNITNDQDAMDMHEEKLILKHGRNASS
jgi:glycosyltransferase involved in cell wall biosynthesis